MDLTLRAKMSLSRAEARDGGFKTEIRGLTKNCVLIFKKERCLGNPCHLGRIFFKLATRDQPSAQILFVRYAPSVRMWCAQTSVCRASCVSGYVHIHCHPTVLASLYIFASARFRLRPKTVSFLSLYAFSSRPTSRATHTSATH